MRKAKPINWNALSTQICDDRARGRCECAGQCGGHRPDALRRNNPAQSRCTAKQGHLDENDDPVKLAPVPMDRVPYHVTPQNLLAMCTPCRRRFEALGAVEKSQAEGLFDLPEAKGKDIPTL